MTVKNLLNLSVVFFFLTSSLTSCIECVEGIGEVVEEPRSVLKYETLLVNCSANVEIRENLINDKNKLIVHAQDNLLPYIKTGVDGKKLVIDMEGCVRPTEPILVEVFTNGLSRISHDGSGNILTRNTLKGESLKYLNHGSGNAVINFEGMELIVSNDGSGDAEFFGTADDLEIDNDGSGDINAVTLKCNHAEVKNGGSGNVSIHVKKSLEISLSGSGDIYYEGNPQDIEQSTSGSGKVKPMD